MASLDSIGGQVQSRAAVVADQHLHTEKSLPQQGTAGDQRQVVNLTGKNSPPSPVAQRETSAENRKVVESVAETLSNYSQNISRELRFSVDESRGEIVITVLNGKTKEVIRQIPPQEILDLARRMKDSPGGLGKGLLVDTVG